MSWVDAPEFVPGTKYIPRPSDDEPHGSSRPSSSVAHPTPATPSSSIGHAHPPATTPNCYHDNTAPSTSLDPYTDHSAPSYSDIATRNLDGNGSKGFAGGSSGELCPYFFKSGECAEGESCINVHGSLCKHCQLYCLHPNDTVMQKYHEDICADIASREKLYNEAAEASKDITCSICYEIVLEKEEKKHRKFGLLSECCHTFCLECIRKWRASQSNNENSKRKCPICRKLSYFIIPSEVWVSDTAEKDRLVQGYKEHLATKDCMHFNKGREHCPFGANCFYKHALPDGTIVSDNVVKRRVNSTGEAVVLATPFLSDFLEELLSYSAAAEPLHIHTLRSLFQEFSMHANNQ